MSLFSKLFIICAALACIVGAYEINVNGQTYQVSVMNEAGGMYTDRTRMTDDHGQKIASQPKAMCSSLRGESCEQVTNNAAKTHNLFNYFPSRADESVVAFANRKYHANQDQSPHLMKQAMDDRTLHYFARQNPYVLGTVATTTTTTTTTAANTPVSPAHAQSLLSAAGIQSLLNQAAGAGAGAGSPLHHIGTKKHRVKLHKHTPADDADTETASDEVVSSAVDMVDADDELSDDEYEEIEVALFGDQELREAMGLDEEEFGDTIDHIVAQLVSSYLDNESEDVDVSKVFASELRLNDGGELSMEQIEVDELSTQEMKELLHSIAEKYQNEHLDEVDSEEQEAHFESSTQDNDDDDDGIQIEDEDNTTLEL